MTDTCTADHGAGRGRCRVLRLRRAAAGFLPGDLLYVLPGGEPEGGEFVVHLDGRVGRHGGGPVWGIVVGALRRSANRTDPPR